MVSIPADNPVTVPPVTEARVFVALHIPPAIVSVRLIDEPAHTIPGPLITPAVAAGTMLIILLVLATPQLFIFT